MKSNAVIQMPPKSLFFRCKIRFSELTHKILLALPQTEVDSHFRQSVARTPKVIEYRQ
jgi:hypothetical protein